MWELLQADMKMSFNEQLNRTFFSRSPNNVCTLIVLTVDAILSEIDISKEEHVLLHQHVYLVSCPGIVISLPSEKKFLGCPAHMTDTTSASSLE